MRLIRLRRSSGAAFVFWALRCPSYNLWRQTDWLLLLKRMATTNVRDESETLSIARSDLNYCDNCTINYWKVTQVIWLIFEQNIVKCVSFYVFMMIWFMVAANSLIISLSRSFFISMFCVENSQLWLYCHRCDISSNKSLDNVSQDVCLNCWETFYDSL